jgi:hypothetical protein
MNAALEQLSALNKAMAVMKQVLLKRKPDDILEHSRRIEKMTHTLRDSMIALNGSSEEDQTQARLMVAELKKTCRSNSSIASTFNMLLKATLSRLTDNPARTSTYGKDHGRDLPASPILVFQKG